MATEGMFFNIGLNVTNALAAARALTQSVGGIKSGFQGLGSVGVAAVRGITSAFQGLGNILFKLPDQARAVSGILRGMSGPLEAAASVEDLEQKIQTLTGSVDGAKSLLSELKRQADSSSYSLLGLADATAILLSFQEPMRDLPKTIAQLGDVAAGDEQKLKELALLWGQARLNEKLYTQDLMQLSLRGIPAMAMLAEQTGKSTAEVREMVEAGEIGFSNLRRMFDDLTSAGGRFENMTATMAATTSGRFSTLMDAWRGLQAAMGKPINTSLRDVMERVGKLMDSLKGKAEQWGQSIANVIDYLTVAADQGRLGEVIGTKLKLAGMELVDLLVKGFQFATEYLSASLEQVGAKVAGLLPGTGDAAKEMEASAARRKAMLMNDGVMGQAGLPAASGLGKILFALRDQSDEMDRQIALGVIGLRLQREKDRLAREAAVNAKGEAEMIKKANALRDKALAAAALDFQRPVVKAKGVWDTLTGAINDAVQAVLNFQANARNSPLFRAQQIVAGALNGAAGAPAGGGAGGGGFGGGGDTTDHGRPGGTRNLGRTGQMMMRFQQADPKKRGSWSDFVKHEMGMDFDKLGDKERAMILAGDPGGKAKNRMGREAERRAASDRMKAVAGAVGATDPKDARGQRTLALLEKYLPEMAKMLKTAVEE
jgi:tape measure domain-containing protein